VHRVEANHCSEICGEAIEAAQFGTASPAVTAPSRLARRIELLPRQRRREDALQGAAPRRGAGATLGTAKTGCGDGGRDDDAGLRAINATVDLDRFDLHFNHPYFALDPGHGAHASAYKSIRLWSVRAGGRFSALRAGLRLRCFPHNSAIRQEFA
jgi:hypothetical protein